MRKPVICFVTAMLLVGLLPLYACKGETSPLAQNEKLWQNKHIQDYSYRLDIGGFRPPPAGNFLVIVRDGKPAGYFRLDEPGDTNNHDVIKYDSFDKIFALLEQSYRDPNLRVGVSYDAVYGFPASVGMYPLEKPLDLSNVIKITEFKLE